MATNEEYERLQAYALSLEQRIETALSHLRDVIKPNSRKSPYPEIERAFFALAFTPKKSRGKQQP